MIMYDTKIGAEVVDVPAGALRRWQDDGRAEVFGDGEYGVMVEYDGPVTATEAAWSGGGRVPLKVELTDTAETAGTLAPFYAFYAAVRRVTLIRIAD